MVGLLRALSRGGDARCNIHGYLELYTVDLGLDNSPLFGWEDRRLVADLRRSYEGFIRDHQYSPSYPIIKGYYGLLKANDFRLSPAAEKFLKKNGPSRR